jgi:hypothetical protein
VRCIKLCREISLDSLSVANVAASYRLSGRTDISTTPKRA